MGRTEQVITVIPGGMGSAVTEAQTRKCGHGSGDHAPLGQTRWAWRVVKEASAYESLRATLIS